MLCIGVLVGDFLDEIEGLKVVVLLKNLIIFERRFTNIIFMDLFGGFIK